jgi:hypothetical protein
MGMEHVHGQGKEDQAETDVDIFPSNGIVIRYKYYGSFATASLFLKLLLTSRRTFRRSLCLSILTSQSLLRRLVIVILQHMISKVEQGRKICERSLSIKTIVRQIIAKEDKIFC